MATDYSILESELTDLKIKLKRDLHMHGVRRLSKKQLDLAKSVIQRRQIENLAKQVAELEPTVSTLYCPQYMLKDNEIKGYLVYLLKMKDYFAREVATKQEIINQRDSQIKGMVRKLCVVTNEKAKIKRGAPAKSPEFIRLENMSDRMNQLIKRICTMRQENKEIMENIMNMRIFQSQFKTFEDDFRARIEYLQDKAQEHLSRAVAAYEEKDGCAMRQRIYEERCAQDKRKAAINQNALNLTLERTEQNDTFAGLQDIIRIDERVAETGDMIEKGITGVEPIMENMQDMRSAISKAAEAEIPEKMEQNFKLADEKTSSMLSYLDHLLKDIQHLENNISELKEENRILINSMSEDDKTLKKDIKLNQDIAQMRLEEADEAEGEKDSIRGEMDSLLATVEKFYKMICPDDVRSLEEKPIKDSNVLNYLENMEKQILDYLICIEYIRMKEASKEESPTLVLEAEEDEDEDEVASKFDVLPVVKPRRLRSKSDIAVLKKMEEEKGFLDFEELKEMSLKVVTEEENESEDESTTSKDSEKK